MWDAHVWLSRSEDDSAGALLGDPGIPNDLLDLCWDGPRQACSLAATERQVRARAPKTRIPRGRRDGRRRRSRRPALRLRGR